MYARLVTGTIAPDELEQAIRLWQDSVLPSVQQQAGFRSVRLLVDREHGRIVSLGFWENESDFHASAEWNQGQIARFANLFASPPHVDGYEVVIEVQR